MIGAKYTVFYTKTKVLTEDEQYLENLKLELCEIREDYKAGKMPGHEFQELYQGTLGEITRITAELNRKPTN